MQPRVALAAFDLTEGGPVEPDQRCRSFEAEDGLRASGSDSFAEGLGFWAAGGWHGNQTTHDQVIEGQQLCT